MWKTANDSLVREFEFKDFKEAFAFITKVALLAEQKDHHPEIRNVYNRVTLSFSTHDAGNIITDKDREMAKLIDTWDL
jgi:4a-hydroxytetrahydrobiopterin dehydratase